MAQTDGRMAVCPVVPMHDDPMISALHNDCALPLAVRGCHPIIFHPNNRATGQRSIRIEPDGCLCMARTDGRMAVCPVDPMNDDPMMSAMLRNCALPLAVRGCHPNIPHPSSRATGQRGIRMRPDGCLCMAAIDGRMAVCPVGPMHDAPMISAMPKDCALYFEGRVRCGAVIRTFPIRAPEQPDNGASEWGLLFTT